MVEEVKTVWWDSDVSYFLYLFVPYTIMEQVTFYIFCLGLFDVLKWNYLNIELGRALIPNSGVLENLLSIIAKDVVQISLDNCSHEEEDTKKGIRIYAFDMAAWLFSGLWFDNYQREGGMNSWTYYYNQCIIINVLHMHTSAYGVLRNCFWDFQLYSSDWRMCRRCKRGSFMGD